MNKKHRKWAKQQHRPEHDKPPADHGGSEASMIYTVKINPNPDDQNRYAEEKQHRADQIDLERRQLGLGWWLNVISGIGGGIAFLALVALCYDAYVVHKQWTAMVESNTINKSAFDRAYRPYIGVNSVGVKYVWNDASGAHFSDAWTREAKDLDFRVEMKNFGPVPGSNYVGSWRVFLNGVEQHGFAKIPANPFTFFPGQNFYLAGAVGTLFYHDIVSGNKTLVLEVTYEYDGPSGHYNDCEKEQYAPSLSAFYSLGVCSS